MSAVEMSVLEMGRKQAQSFKAMYHLIGQPIPFYMLPWPIQIYVIITEKKTFCDQGNHTQTFKYGQNKKSVSLDSCRSQIYAEPYYDCSSMPWLYPHDSQTEMNKAMWACVYSN